MKVLILPRYGRKGASSRLRMLQYQPPFRSLGLDADVSPFFDDEYLSQLYGSQPTGRSVRQAYLRRVRKLAAVGADVPVIWLEKEALPWFPWTVERAMMPSGVPLVSDYDDAVFHRYDLHKAPGVRRVLGHKIDRVMAASTLVTAGNGYLADRARAAGARWIEVVPTVVDVTSYFVRRPEESNYLSIGWIGTPSTWIEYMAPLMPLLADVAGRHGARISAVGAGDTAHDHPMLDKIPWAEDTEISSIQAMDVGIMPLIDTPWARGKCGFKLIQYMACGLPVVASPVGVNAEIVEDGVTGILATTASEWREALTTLLRDPALRRQMGDAGRRKIEKHYALSVWAPQVAELLLSVMKSAGQSSAIEA